jgi:glucose-1-phosphate thymidylyltransferase
VVLSPAKSEVFRYLGSGEHLGMDLGYLCQEEPLGMPHAIDLAAPFLAGQTVCMGMPDTIVAPGDCFAALLDFHDGTRADLSLGVFPAADPRALAPVVIEPGSYRVLGIVDKPAEPPAANTWGIAAWSPAFTELLHGCVADARSRPEPGRERRRELPLTDVFVAAMTAGLRVHALAFESGEYHDIGDLANVMRARARVEDADGVMAGSQP